MSKVSMALSNYKVLQNTNLVTLPPLAILVGANGTGKSTFFDAFAFLRDCLVHNVRKALWDRGGFREVVSRGHENESIELWLKLPLTMDGRPCLASYHLEIAQKKSPFVSRESLVCEEQDGATYPAFEFSMGRGYAVAEGVREEFELGSDDILALKGLGQFRRFREAYALRKAIEGWHVFCLSIDAVRRAAGMGCPGEDEHLSPTGDNLRHVARRLWEEHPERFARILDAMKIHVPELCSIIPHKTQDGRELLQFGFGRGREFCDSRVSRGSLALLAHLVLFGESSPHSLLCVDCPESHLYPGLLAELVENFRAYADRGGQVLIATHSSDLLNAVEPEEVFCFMRDKSGFAQIVRALDIPGVAVAMEKGESMGHLLEQGMLCGTG